jgi:NAD(P)-dependent dehydrogenase (short-subunit alcohol dehydrogenase family)
MSEQNSQQSAGKIAIVTGGSRGIGRNTVVSLARRGVHSILTYHSHRVEADAVVAAVRDAGDTGRCRATRYWERQRIR